MKPLQLVDRRDAASLIVLVLLAVAWASPLIATITTHLPGSQPHVDVAAMAWNVWWVQHALETTAPLFRSDAILIPFGADLRMHNYGLFPAAVVSPLARLAGAHVAYNLMLIGTIALNGCVAYALFRLLPVRRTASLAAAAGLMLSGPVLDQMIAGRPIYASLWITCAALIAGQRLIARPSVLSGATLGATVTLALFTDLQMLLFTCLWLALLAGWTVWHERGIDRARLVAALVALVIVTVPFIVVFYDPLLGQSRTSVARPAASEAVVYSYRWWDYVTPWVIPRALGGYELALALVAGVLLVKREPRLRFWLSATTVFLVLALGPQLKFTTMPLPFALFQLFGPLEHFRMPSRLTIPAMIGVAAVGAIVLDRILTSRMASRAGAVVAALLIVRLMLAAAQHPLATQQFPAYAVYHHISAGAQEGAVIEVPFGIRSGLDRIGSGGEALQYYQQVHGRPILNATVGRLPPSVFEWYRQRPSLMVLAGVNVDATDDALLRDFTEVLDVTDAAYVLIHREMMTPDALARAQRLVHTHSRVQWWREEGTLVAYRVRAR
jgi:hypothetical protein